MNGEMIWFQLTSLVDRLNRSVKEPGWGYEDKTDVYKLKDQFLDKLLRERPKEVEISLYYVPYLRYSQATKDRAGELMRRDGKRQSFEYYLDQVEPSAADREDPSRASIEVIAKCGEQSFSLHMPVENLPPEYKVDEIPRKKWIPSPEFHHSQLETAKEQYEQLMKMLQ